MQYAGPEVYNMDVDVLLRVVCKVRLKVVFLRTCFSARDDSKATAKSQLLRLLQQLSFI